MQYYQILSCCSSFDGLQVVCTECSYSYTTFSCLTHFTQARRQTLWCYVCFPLTADHATLCKQRHLISIIEDKNFVQFNYQTVTCFHISLNYVYVDSGNFLAYVIGLCQHWIYPFTCILLHLDLMHKRFVFARSPLTWLSTPQTLMGWVLYGCWMQWRPAV